MSSAAHYDQEAPDSAPEQRSGPLPQFGFLYARFFDFVWRSTKRLGVKPESMDDVVQDIFISIYKKLATVKSPESLRSWIYGVVRRTVSRYHRKRRSRHASGEALFARLEVDPQPRPPTPLDLTQQSDELKLVRELLDGIVQAKREVLLLAELEQMTAPEIAEVLAIPVNTVYSRLRAARQEFEHALARRLARRRERK